MANMNALYEVHQYQKPQVNLSCSTPIRMWLVALCALLAVVQSSLSDGFSSLFLALAAVLTAVLTEFLILKKSDRISLLKDGSAVASALVLTLLLPNRINPVFACFGAVFAIAIIKHSFGGLGSNWLNPAAGAWLFIRLSWPNAFNQALESSSAEVIHARDFILNQNSILDSFRLFLNSTVFSFVRAELPGPYLNLFLSGRPGIIADRGILALLLGTIIISAFQASRIWVPAVWLGVFVLITRLAGALPHGGGWWEGDILYTLLTGGTLVSAFILAADPVTSAKSSWGIIGAAILGAFLAWFFRFPGAEPYGAVFSIVFINALLPMVRNIENSGLYEKRRKP